MSRRLKEDEGALVPRLSDMITTSCRGTGDQKVCLGHAG